MFNSYAKLCHTIVVAGAGLTLSFSLANAATLSSVTGSVVTNSGGGFVGATVGSEVPAGTLVMARENGSATIAYSASCVVQIVPGKVYTVSSEVPCNGAGSGSGEAAAINSQYTIGVGAVAVGAAGVGALILSSKRTSPASP
jgi:hypothetical protein